MRYRVYAILHMIIMLLYISRPAPYTEYLLFKDYIANNLCEKKDQPGNNCQGECHLNKQLEKGEEANDPAESNANKKNNYEHANEFFVALIALPTLAETTLHNTAGNDALVASQLVSNIFVPPKA